MTEKNLFVPVSKELHQQVKEHCVKEEISIQDLVVKLVNKEIKKAAKRKVQSK